MSDRPTRLEVNRYPWRDSMIAEQMSLALDEEQPGWSDANVVEAIMRRLHREGYTIVRTAAHDALKRRPTVANHNALQEECDSRLVVHKRQCERITELETEKRKSRELYAELETVAIDNAGRLRALEIERTELVEAKRLRSEENEKMIPVLNSLSEVVFAWAVELFGEVPSHVEEILRNKDNLITELREEIK